MVKKLTSKLKTRRRVKAKPATPLTVPKTKQLLAMLWQSFRARQKLFVGVFVVQIALLFVFVWSSGGATDVNELKTTVNETLGTNNTLVSNATVTGLLFASFGSVSSEVVSVYQSMIFLICGLTYVWAFRHVYEKTMPHISVKTAFYKSTAQLIPFLAVLLILGLQLIPLTAGLGVVGATQTGSVVVTGAEQTIIGVIVLLMAFVTFYFANTTLFALFVVTLPDAAPIGSLRSARKLVEFRRWVIMRRLLLGGLLLLLCGGLILLATVSLLPSATNIVLFLCSSLMLPLGVGYTYTLYKELL